MFEVGKKYTAKNGHGFECIAVTDDHAWMKSHDHAAAYVWHHNGTCFSLGSEYDVKPAAREYTLDPDKNHIWFSHIDGMIHVREVLE